MKADLSRSTFAPDKHYRDVRWQMGRVSLDADFNEYVDIAAHRIETGTIDVVGRCGGPMHDAGFQLAAAAAGLPPAQQAAGVALGALGAGDFLLSAGRYYVQGVLVQNESPIKFSDQSTGDLPGATPVKDSGLYLAYLDVWGRLITAIDDPAIREVALGGPDTATRTKNVWQLKLVRVGNAGAAADCEADFAAFTAATAAPTGRLAAEVDPNPTSQKPCILPPGGGYRRLENQLYRVEVHTAGDADGAATFKWSRDNGSVVSGWDPTGEAKKIRLRHPPRDQVLGFAIGQTVELTDDTNELLATTGFLTEVTAVDGELLELKDAPPAGQFVRNPKVRRWDSAGAAAVTTADWIALEDGVRVRFAAGSYRTGDYWMIPARTATADVEWPRTGANADFLPPRGVAHRYCRVGFVDFDGANCVMHDCRKLFPPLTELDRDCDLKLHNKHLHGKGVVCGLQVNCGGDDGQQTVVVKPGHAIDCEGTDVLLKAPRGLAVVEQAKAAKLIDDRGNGDVLVALKADAADQPVFSLRAAPAEPKGIGGIIRHLLEGTLWMDFYQDCLKPMVEELRGVLLDPDPADQRVVNEQKRRLITLTNLLAHRSGRAPSRRLWLSAADHERLKTVYEAALKAAGQSHVFCGLDDTFAPFPAYPFAGRKIDTAFAGRRVQGLRMAPDGKTALAWSDEAAGTLLVFDLGNGELAREVKIAGAENQSVKDVTFAAFGQKPAVVVAAAGGNNTTLAVLVPETLDPVTAPFALGGAVLTRLETHPRRPGTVFAVQRGAGVHFLDLDQLASGPLGAPGAAFRAAGHLVVTDGGFIATVGRGTDPLAGVYDALVMGGMGGAREILGSEVPLSRIQPGVTSGSDGLAMDPALPRQLFVVVDPPSGKGAKQVMRIAIAGANEYVGNGLFDLPLADDGGPTGAVGIAVVPRTGQLAVTVAGRNQVVWMSQQGVPGDWPTLPVQAGPLALAVMPAGGGAPELIVANHDNLTLTRIPVKEFGAPVLTDAAIAAYRDAVLAVFERLVLVLLQQLKDCLCEHLLLDCPECGPDDAVILAKIEVRNGEVYHICNFDRDEVLTFPKVKYWLSAVPVIPLLGFLVEKFCCWIIAPPVAGAQTAGNAAVSGAAAAPKAGMATALLSPAVVLQAAQSLRSGAVQEFVGANLERFKALAGHFADGFSVQSAARPTEAAQPPVKVGEVVGSNANQAQQEFGRRGVAIAKVRDYESALRDDGALMDANAVPTNLRPGDKVELFTRGGVVAFYRKVADPAPVAPAPEVKADLDQLRGAVTRIEQDNAAALAARDRTTAELKASNLDLKATVDRLAAASAAGPAPSGPTVALADFNALRAQLDAVRASQAAELAARDRAIGELKATNDSLQAAVQRIASAPPPAAPDTSDLQAKLVALSGELAALKQRQAEDLAVRDRQLADLAASNRKLATDLTAANTRLDTEIVRIGRINPRPPNG